MGLGLYTPHYVAGYERFVVEGVTTHPRGYVVELTTYLNKPTKYNDSAPGFHVIQNCADSNGRVVFELPKDTVWAVVELFDSELGGYVYLQ